jgi:hypothetical protein
MNAIGQAIEGIGSQDLYIIQNILQVRSDFIGKLEDIQNSHHRLQLP